MEPLLYTSDCRACAYLLLSPSNDVVCPRCNSANNCSPPVPIYVPPRHPHQYMSRDFELGQVLGMRIPGAMGPTPGELALLFRAVSPDFEYRRDRELEEVMNRSFQEEMEPESRPASEQTRAAMQTATLANEPGFARECSICLDVMRPTDDTVLTTCCNQYAHRDCMDKSLNVVPNCPFCRWSA